MGISSSVVAGSAWIIGGVLPFGRDAYAVPVKNVSWNSLYRGVSSMAALNRNIRLPRIRSKGLGSNVPRFCNSAQHSWYVTLVRLAFFQVLFNTERSLVRPMLQCHGLSEGAPEIRTVW